MIVFGRIMATAIFYGAALNVGLYQYKNFRNGIFDFHTKLTLITSAPGKLIALIGGLFTATPRVRVDPQPQPEKECRESCMPEVEREEDKDDLISSDETDADATAKEDDQQKDELSKPGDDTAINPSEDMDLTKDDENVEVDDDDEEQEEEEEQKEDEAGSPEEENEPDSFRPFFFLDNVIA